MQGRLGACSCPFKSVISLSLRTKECNWYKLTKIEIKKNKKKKQKKFHCAKKEKKEVDKINLSTLIIL